MINSIDIEKSFKKIESPFLIKPLSKLGIVSEHVLNLIKCIYKKATASIILNSERLIVRVMSSR